MSSSAVLDIIEIRGLVDRLFARIEDAGIRRIPIRNAAYWSVFYGDAFDVDPPEVVIGDVLDDLRDLREEVNQFDGGDNDQAVLSVWHAFHHLSGLAQFIAHSASQGLISNEDPAGAAP